MIKNSKTIAILTALSFLALLMTSCRGTSDADKSNAEASNVEEQSAIEVIPTNLPSETLESNEPTTKTQEIQFVSVDTTMQSGGNGWNNGETLLGFLNTGKDMVCSMDDYRITSEPTLKTQEGKDYPVSVDITGKFSIYPDDNIPFSDFPPIPPGFKIYTFGQNDTYIYLNYQYAQAATPKQIEFSQVATNRAYDLLPQIDLSNNMYSGNQMTYDTGQGQPVIKISSLKGMGIEMTDDELEASFTGSCYRAEKTNILSTEGLFAEIRVTNTDKFDDYYPKSTWHIGYYFNGRGIYKELDFTKPGVMINPVGPGMEDTLYFELGGTIVIFKGDCPDEYFILDYSECNQ